MTACSRRVFVNYHERVNRNVRLGYVPLYHGVNSRVHIMLSEGGVVGRTVCNVAHRGSTYEAAMLDDEALPCAHCFDRALTAAFRQERKAEETPGKL